MKQIICIAAFASLILGGWASARQNQLKARVFDFKSNLNTQASCDPSDPSDPGQ